MDISSLTARRFFAAFYRLSQRHPKHCIRASHPLNHTRSFSQRPSLKSRYFFNNGVWEKIEDGAPATSTVAEVRKIAPGPTSTRQPIEKRSETNLVGQITPDTIDSQGPLVFENNVWRRRENKTQGGGKEDPEKDIPKLDKQKHSDEPLLVASSIPMMESSLDESVKEIMAADPIKNMFQLPEATKEDLARNQIEASSIRKLMRKVAGPVAIVTSTFVKSTTSNTGEMVKVSEPAGLTLSSFNTVSLNPPMVSFNIKLPSSTWWAIVQSGGFLVHLLADNPTGVKLAQIFSKRDPFLKGVLHTLPTTLTEIDRANAPVNTNEPDSFIYTETPNLRLPLISSKPKFDGNSFFIRPHSSTYTVFECSLDLAKCVTVGDHKIVVGQIADIIDEYRKPGNKCGLAYQDGKYFSFSKPKGGEDPLAGREKEAIQTPEAQISEEQPPKKQTAETQTPKNQTPKDQTPEEFKIQLLKGRGKELAEFEEKYLKMSEAELHAQILDIMPDWASKDPEVQVLVQGLARFDLIAILRKATGQKTSLKGVKVTADMRFLSFDAVRVKFLTCLSPLVTSYHLERIKALSRPELFRQFGQGPPIHTRQREELEGIYSSLVPEEVKLSNPSIMVKRRTKAQSMDREDLVAAIQQYRKNLHESKNGAKTVKRLDPHVLDSEPARESNPTSPDSNLGKELIAELGDLPLNSAKGFELSKTITTVQISSAVQENAMTFEENRFFQRRLEELGVIPGLLPHDEAAVKIKEAVRAMLEWREKESQEGFNPFVDDRAISY